MAAPTAVGVAPIHDALLIGAPLDRLESDIDTARAAMADASRVVLGGFELGTDAFRLLAGPPVTWIAVGGSCGTASPAFWSGPPE